MSLETLRQGRWEARNDTVTYRRSAAPAVDWGSGNKSKITNGGHSLQLTYFSNSLEKDHWTTAQGDDLRRSQLWRTSSDQQLRAEPTEYVDSISANVCWSLCVDPVARSKN